MSNYEILIEKLDKFSRKYYVNQLIKGSLITLAVLLLVFLIINLGEYYLYFSGTIRKILFFGFIITSLAMIAGLVIKPILKWYKLGKQISQEQAADIIGRHFTDVQDKLLNVLQLNKQQIDVQNMQLVAASIDQKALELKPVPFSSAINLQENKKYLKYALPPLLLLLLIVIMKADIITDGSNRLINNDQYFEKAMPFQFIIKNKELQAMQFSDYELNILLEGESLPNQVQLVMNGNQYSLSKQNKEEFKHTFYNLQQEQIFYLQANGFRSQDYQIKLLKKPIIKDFRVALDYPAYTGVLDQELKNVGDLSIPEGTVANWFFNTEGTELLRLGIGDSLYQTERKGEQLFQFKKQLLKSQDYKLFVSNQDVPTGDSIGYQINVLKDQYPEIRVKEQQDSLNLDYHYYIGELGDDYGLRNLYFRYKIERVDSASPKSYRSKTVPFNKTERKTDFNFYWNVKEYKLAAGDVINYYFEIYDNDAINGSKNARTALMVHKMPTKEEMEQIAEENNQAVKDALADAMKDSKELKEDIKDIREKMLDKKNVSWEDKEQLKNFLEKQKNLEKKLSEMDKKMEENFKQQNENQNYDEQIAEKQEKLEEMFESMFDEEMKELMKKMEEMMEKMDKKNMMNELADMEFNDEQMEKELDKMMELFKKLEFEMKAQETMEKLEELAEMQEELSEQSEQKRADREEIKEQQEKLNKDFEDVKEDMEDMKEMNEELADKADMEEVLEKQEEVEDKMKDANDELDSGKMKDASEQQKGASQKIQEMAESMQMMMEGMQMQQAAEDMEALRRLLDNLVHLSQDQESLMAEIKGAKINTPEYVGLIQEQHKIMDDSKMVEDSLYALAKRQFQIESFVTKEIADINKNLNKSIERLEARKKSPAAANQQYVMTGYNNLALMLSEAMEQMQQQMAMSMPGNQSCQKPGGKGGKMPSLSKMQQQLNDQMQQMGEQMKSVGGGQKEGEQGSGGNGTSKQFAQMAAQQAAIRQKLKEIQDSENKDGRQTLGDLQKIMDQMEKTETQLVNKQLTTELLKRQADIQTRLLEAVDAERQREEEKKREAQTAEEYNREAPPSLEKYLKRRNAEIDKYKAKPVDLRPWYKILVEDYYKNISFTN